MRILAAPQRLALDPAAPIVVDLIVHNDSTDDGVAFPTFVSDEGAAEATFEPTIGFLAAGTAQRFRVYVSARPLRGAHAHAQWILFAGGEACERRDCALVSFEAVSAPSFEAEPESAIDPERKAEILALAQAPSAPPRVRRAFNPFPPLVIAIVAIAGIVAGLRFVPRTVAPQPSLATAAAAPIPTRVAAAAHVVKEPASRPLRVAKRPAPVRVAPPPQPQPIGSHSVRLPHPHHAAAPRKARSARITRSQTPRAAPPALLALDAPHEVHAESDLMVRVNSKRAATVRIVVKLGPVILFERTLPGGNATAVVRAPGWAGHAQLLTVRVWAKNAVGSSSSYATVALVQ